MLTVPADRNLLISCALLVLGVMISGPLPGSKLGGGKCKDPSWGNGLFPDFCVVSSGFADEPSGGSLASVQWRYEKLQEC